MGRHIKGHGTRHHPREPERHGAKRRGVNYGVAAFGWGNLPSQYGQGSYDGTLGQVTSANNPPVSGPAPPGIDPGGMSPHLQGDQFGGDNPGSLDMGSSGGGDAGAGGDSGVGPAGGAGGTQ